MSIQDDFRLAMRSYIYSVSVLSNKSEDGVCNAITVSSVTSISMEPPSLLVCINKDSKIHDELSAGSEFCINLLTKEQQDISNVCSSESMHDKRFDDPNWDVSHTPYLKNAQANIFCKVDNLIPYHTHTIVLAHVTKSVNKYKINTLTYVDGSYA